MCRRSFDSMIVWHNDNRRFLWSPQSWTFDQVYSTVPEISPVKQAWYPVRELLVIPINHHVTTAFWVLLHLASGYILPGKLLLHHAGSRTRGNGWCSFSPSTLRSSFWYCASEPSGKKCQASRGWFLCSASKVSSVFSDKVLPSSYNRKLSPWHWHVLLGVSWALSGQ